MWALVPLVKRPRLALLRTVAVAALGAAVNATGAGAATAKVIGPDVSSHNHDNRAALNWLIMHRVGGAEFTFIKATEGGGYRNPNFSSDFASARQRGVIRGAYHYARPSGATSAQIVANATAQANYYVHVAGAMGGPGSLPPVLDLEEAGNLNPTQLTLWTHTWLDWARHLTGRTPIVYTSKYFWRDKTGNSTRFAANPLWLASYGVKSPALVGGWKRYTFWQYTDAGRLAGSGRPVDLSVFNGSLAQLSAMTSVTSVKPKKSVTSATWVTSMTLRYTTRAQTKRAQTSGAQTSGAPTSGAPTSGAPTSGAQTSGAQTSGAQTSGAQTSGAQTSGAQTNRADVTSSRSSLRSWLTVHGMDGSRKLVGR